MLDMRRSPIAKRLTWMNILVSGAALLAACAAFLAYDQYTFRESLVKNLAAQAQIIGFNSVSALTFNDPQAAKSTLSALANSPDIVEAAIFASDGVLFAQFSRERDGRFVGIAEPLGRNEAVHFGDTHVTILEPIVFQGRRIGTVYIRSDLQERARRLKRYGAIAAAVLLLSLLAALLVSSLFRKSFAEPIVRLAETARTVSEERNYSIRVPATGRRDEVSVLIDAFNNMLAQIQQRDQALRAAQDELEQRVDERTRQLVAANRELEAFSYSVSHDLRGPLEVINGFAHILQTEYGVQLDTTARECVQQINSSTRRMSELIDDLLNLSRVSTTAMHRERVNLTAMGRSIMEQFARREPARQVEFLAQEGMTVEADSRLMRIVLENLLRNAWKYTSKNESAHIAFGYEKRLGRDTFFVRDDGAGFDHTMADRLFKPFQRLHSTSEFAGTGIGLATVHRIIARHGGEVWAEGEQHKGATFYFTLQ
jgi:signal transduction histidine kinase